MTSNRHARNYADMMQQPEIKKCPDVPFIPITLYPGTVIQIAVKPGQCPALAALNWIKRHDENDKKLMR